MLQTFTAVSYPVQHWSCAAGQGAAPLMLLRGLAAFLTLMVLVKDWREDAIHVFSCQDFTAFKLLRLIFPVVLIPRTYTEGQARTLVGRVTSCAEIIHWLESRIALNVNHLIIKADILSLFNSTRINVEYLHAMPCRPVLYKTINEKHR